MIIAFFIVVNSLTELKLQLLELCNSIKMLIFLYLLIIYGPFTYSGIQV